MPTSITTAPSRTSSPVTNPARPIATTRMSAERRISRRSRERLCATVTVASPPLPLPIINNANGLPTSKLRPSMTTRAPAVSTPASIKQPLAAQRRAGHEAARVAHGQLADVDRVEPVHVLGRVDGEHDRRFVDVLGRRRLHEDAVDRRVVVEPGDHVEQLGLGRLGGQFELDRVHPDLLAHAVLRADVGTRRWVVADEHHRQARGMATGLEGFDLRAALGQHGFRDGRAVNDAGRVIHGEWKCAILRCFVAGVANIAGIANVALMAENGQPVARIPDKVVLEMEPGFDCYQALRARDARFDGLFFVGVKTTGIYCRPVCPARTPQAGSCVFVATAAAAERAGFRPCLRCRPELAPAGPLAPPPPRWNRRSLPPSVARAAGDSVEDLAAHTGFSARQLRRLTLRAFGVTPVEIVQTERLLFAKKLLQETALPVTDRGAQRGVRQPAPVQRPVRARYRPAALRVAAAFRHASARARHPPLRLAYRPPLAWRELSPTSPDAPRPASNGLRPQRTATRAPSG